LTFLDTQTSKVLHVPLSDSLDVRGINGRRKIRRIEDQFSGLANHEDYGIIVRTDDVDAVGRRSPKHLRRENPILGGASGRHRDRRSSRNGRN
jgi:hypothetical protein